MERLSLDEGQNQKIRSIIAETPIFRALKPELIPQLISSPLAV